MLVINGRLFGDSPKWNRSYFQTLKKDKMQKKKSNRKKDLRNNSTEFKFSVDFETKPHGFTPRHPLHELRSEYMISSLFQSNFEFDDVPIPNEHLQQFRGLITSYQATEEQLKNLFSQIVNNTESDIALPNLENLNFLDAKSIIIKKPVEKPQEIVQQPTNGDIKSPTANSTTQQRKPPIPANKTKTKTQTKQTLELSDSLKAQLTLAASSTPKEEPKPVKLFKFTPESVSFTDFTPGKWMEAVVEIKNVSGSNKMIEVSFAGAGTRITISPPNTKNFQVRNVEYPTEGSLVASGLHVKVTIRFLPDQLRDFSDTLVVR